MRRYDLLTGREKDIGPGIHKQKNSERVCTCLASPTTTKKKKPILGTTTTGSTPTSVIVLYDIP